jgi:hypothetical protein
LGTISAAYAISQHQSAQITPQVNTDFLMAFKTASQADGFGLIISPSDR